jgi:ComEC/Rec2-related protein
MDLVQYKLQTIDQRKAGLHGLLYRAVESKPLAFCAIGLMSSIVIEQYAGTGIGDWLVLLVITTIIGLPLCLLSKHNWRPLITAIAAMLAFACLGGIRLVSATRIDQRDLSSLVSHDGTIADLRGRIAGSIRIEDESGWEFGEFQQKDPSSGFDLDVQEARCISGWEKVTGTVRINVGEPVHDLKAGDLVQVYTTLNRFRGAMNPGGFDARNFYEGQGLRLAAMVKSRAGIEPWLIDEKQQSSFRRFQQWLRDAAAGKLKWGQAQEDESYGMLEALLLGTRSDITPQTYEAFRRTGLLHYVSLSGMNISFVIAAVWLLAKVAGVTRRKRVAICILAIILFLILVPAQSPILRAGVIGLVFCMAVLLRREGNSINTLALAAIIILLFSPLELFSIGWQLSFGCVLGILLFFNRLEFAFYDIVSRLMRQNLSPEDLRKGIGPKFLRAAVTLMATGLAAWLGGAGLMLYHFYNITPLASLWTAITSPLMAAIMVLGYLKIMLSAVLPTLGTILAPVVSMLSWAFIESVKLMGPVAQII